MCTEFFPSNLSNLNVAISFLCKLVNPQQNFFCSWITFFSSWITFLVVGLLFLVVGLLSLVVGLLFLVVGLLFLVVGLLLFMFITAHMIWGIYFFFQTAIY